MSYYDFAGSGCPWPCTHIPTCDEAGSDACVAKCGSDWWQMHCRTANDRLYGPNPVVGGDIHYAPGSPAAIGGGAAVETITQGIGSITKNISQAIGCPSQLGAFCDYWPEILIGGGLLLVVILLKNR